MTSESIYQFIHICSQRFNNKYDYSLVKFNKLSDKITIICPHHGKFTQVAGDHKRSKLGCYMCNKSYPKCTKTKRTISSVKTDFIKVHGQIYDYSLVEDTKTRNKVTIICKKHGKFNQSINSHLCGQGCPTCAIANRTPSVKSYTYTFPSGNKYQVQGYEPRVIDSLLKEGYTEDMLQLKDRAAVKYFWDSSDGYGDDKWHWYFPDIVIPSENKIIEVKSTFSYDGRGARPDWKSKNLAKKKYCIKAGYSFEFRILDEKRL
jgi:hypothetical protein